MGRCGRWCCWPLTVLLPVAIAFAIVSRARVFVNRHGNLDSEWQDIGFEASKYKLRPSATPTWYRPGTLTGREMLRRGVLEPLLALELWEALLVMAVAVATARAHSWMFVHSRRQVAEAGRD